MLYLKTYWAELSKLQLKKIPDLKDRLAQHMRPLLQPTLGKAGEVLGTAPEELRSSKTGRREFFEPRRIATEGEIFTDGRSLIVLSVYEDSSRRTASIQRAVASEEQAAAESRYRLGISAVGPVRESDSLTHAVAVAKEILAVSMQPHSYKRERFEALKAEGRETPTAPSPGELKAAQLLGDRIIRALALAIKSSGGLLVRDLPKQLPEEARDRVDALTSALRDSGAIESEIVIVCRKSQAQITRAPSRAVLDDISQKGLKCACGRPLAEERVEEALAVTDLGRSLLDKARWLTVLLVEELRAVGIERDAVIVEQNVGGDEIDCLANVSGELTLFELKDREFSLGNAYSFGAKIAIIRPEHPVIITTERVGNDAKDHFVRARLAGGPRERIRAGLDEETGKITYIEGVENLKAGIQELVGAINREDAVKLLDDVLPLAAMDGQALLHALERPGASATVQQRDAAEATPVRTE
jgi:hypothetical protein